MTSFTYYQSPLGLLTLQANEKGLLGIWLPVNTTLPQQLGTKDEGHPILKEAIQQLEEYFAKKRTQFSVPVAPKGTPFQQQVWQALEEIPFGETRTYQQLAIDIDNPKAVRAVGMANGKNPISIIIPCHRVIGKNGKLTGYAGGIDAKKALLELEVN
ncbi:methylated-DNA--[protein]-cysteine S-methyltransferase [Vibrio genomosp. F10]|uniref:Methylated-DNA--protein-cysteine methyltransferase n=2 Tax=Vibrio genomosp. F10 TaxID=723171 RepID=A0A1B9QYF9_9VIBR|nr:methylated-DNA--[protein]-cysteine S-methyltransferase [Vibrio genomosp. F10]OCH75675.1 cysteine methyltransferase [Vibrio genomosp. F10]OEE30665.1 cysteine methyltransferase [Vibrio genomosp. F10 str. ZF-129]OEE94791.1 cysteine methyltransferase [Vibrio genomosp. F10 str. 9ZC157]OEF08409.1 cysteine methyltransferase [Vibrio genomosp. F10 str. 9ZB36]OEF18607.1 cysteine methyltransferase [Vibrio genomosp. F10 str. 9ZD137]